jgi:Zn-dependent peptidase ImmA (M78 family)
MPSRQQAERAARDLLLKTWSPDLANCPLPIDSFFVAGQLGLAVVRTPLEPDVSGMLVKRVGEDPTIYVNGRDHPNRQRFSCAHELGHYVERATSAADDSWGYIDRRGPSASHGTDPAEIHANQFAAALLMPAERVRATSHLSPPAMAVEFGVSVDAMTNRLKNLNLLIW